MDAAKPPPGGLLTYGLFTVFGVSAWVTVNGIFAQLPLLAARQPEGALPHHAARLPSCRAASTTALTQLPAVAAAFRAVDP